MEHFWAGVEERLPFFLRLSRLQLRHYDMPVNPVTLSANWHIAREDLGATIRGHRKTMGLADWSELERRGLIQPSPGREEAVKATHEHTAAKRQAQREKMQAPPARRKRRP